MPKTALVLSGGGAKGAFQAAVAKYAHDYADYRWGLISGVSVGALNGALMAMNRYLHLEAIWKNISNRKVYSGKRNWWAYVKMFLGADAIHGHGPLRKMIEREVDPTKMSVPFSIGAVSLTTGEYVRFEPGNPEFLDALLASTAIPIFFPPVDVSDRYPSMVDGGIRNLTPVGDVLHEEPDEIVIINCNPRKLARMDRKPDDGIEVGERSLEIMMNEIFLNDVDNFCRINRLVLQAGMQDVVLKKRNGDLYKAYRCTIIEPDEPLGDTLDFSEEMVMRSWRAGWDKAHQVFGKRKTAQ